MPNKSYRNAIKEAIELEMRRDPSVIVLVKMFVVGMVAKIPMTINWKVLAVCLA